MFICIAVFVMFVTVGIIFIVDSFRFKRVIFYLIHGLLVLALSLPDTFAILCPNNSVGIIIIVRRSVQ